MLQCAYTSNQPWWLTWPVEEVAAAILPLFSNPQFSPSKGETPVLDDIVAWCKTGRFTEWKLVRQWADPFADADCRAINEAIQVLEQTRLIVRSFRGSEGATSYLGLTRLGMHALQTNTVRQHLGLSDEASTGP